MKLIVGLGNIGDEYAKTNHNAGFMIVDKLAEKCGFSFKNRGCESDYAEYNSEIIMISSRAISNFFIKLLTAFPLSFI